MCAVQYSETKHKLALLHWRARSAAWVLLTSVVVVSSSFILPLPSLRYVYDGEPDDAFLFSGSSLQPCTGKSATSTIGGFESSRDNESLPASCVSADIGRAAGLQPLTVPGEPGAHAQLLGTSHSCMAHDDGTGTQDVQLSSVASLPAAVAAASFSPSLSASPVSASVSFCALATDHDLESGAVIGSTLATVILKVVHTRFVGFGLLE